MADDQPRPGAGHDDKEQEHGEHGGDNSAAESSSTAAENNAAPESNENAGARTSADDNAAANTASTSNAGAGERGRPPLAPSGIRRSSTMRVSRTRDWEGQREPPTRRPRASTSAVRPRNLEPLQPSLSPPGIGIRRRVTMRSDTPRRNSVGAVSSGRAPSIPGDFTLAGPQDQVAVVTQHQPYVDPGYTDLNPAYEQPLNVRPVWGLAKPLPRVVRPGMVPSASELDLSKPAGGANDKVAAGDKTDIDLEKGKVQPTLKLGKISSKLDTARERRENRVLQRYGSRTSAFPPFNRDARPVDTSLAPHEEVMEEEEWDEEDQGSERPEDHEAETSTSPYRLPDDAASISTAREEDDEEWMADTTPLKPYGPEDEVHNLHTHWSVVRAKFREPFAEFLAVIVQLSLGFGADLVATVSRGKSGNEVTTVWAWGTASMLGIYIAGGISGAHLNPAISLTLYFYRGFPLRKVPGYIFAQILGAFVAALIAYGVFRAAILEYDAGATLEHGGTVDNFITGLRYDWIDACTGFFTEFTGTAFLAIAVLALGDDSNAPPGAGMSAFVLGLVIALLCLVFGYNTGAALNPSRDFGARLAVWALGYGRHVFTNGYWVYGPWAGTITGALVGAGLYDIFIFVGGESPVNYPRKRMKRAGRKWRHRWAGRMKRAKAKLRRRDDGDGGLDHDADGDFKVRGMRRQGKT
ncbi:MAG: hypothetical protein M1819_002743 [Sarea resinae]|nr:MAG: hypothetical protein M1819_002743 [Sarea resinae]